VADAASTSTSSSNSRSGGFGEASRMPTAFPLALNLTDSVAEWPEIAIVIAIAFLGAYFVASLFSRAAHWLLRNLLTSIATRRQLQLQPRMRGRHFFWVRVLIFLVTWIALSLPMLDAIGLPLELGDSRVAMRRWIISSGFKVAVILLISSLILRISRTTTDRLEHELATSGDLDVIERTRRAQTIGRLVQSLIAVVVSTIALLMVLRELGVDIMPMLTGAGIVGVALGFGSQYLVRDVIAGFFLILENQVSVGDAAVVNGIGGTIESVNLRTITLRDGEGTVHMFQNGAISTLANRSKDYAYYVIDVNVLYEQNTDQVVAVLKDAGAELAADPQYKDYILEPLEVLGVDAFLDAKVTIKIRIKTKPLKQWDVGRELRRRIMIALERNNIAMQPSSMQVYLRPVKDTTAQ
jgi:small conductance mechanosensitive channel